MIKKIISVFLVLSLVLGSCGAGFSTNSSSFKIDQIKKLVLQAENEILTTGAAKDSTIDRLNTVIMSVDLTTGSYGTDFGKMSTSGYGQSNDLGKGWSYRVDRPNPNSGDAKPHVHVYKDGNQVGVENVDETSSHGKDLGSVPKDVKKKVRSSKDYKKGKEDLKKRKDAKAEISRQHINLNTTAGLVIAVGIFIVIVGALIFAPEALPFILAGI